VTLFDPDPEGRCPAQSLASPTNIVRCCAYQGHGGEHVWMGSTFVVTWEDNDDDVTVWARQYVPKGPVPAAPARHGDPRTSHAAAKTTADVGRFGKNSYSGRLLRHFDAASLTDHEATRRVLGDNVDVSKFEGCRRRCSDLRAAGYIADAGLERDGRIVWTITEQGEDALYRMKLTGWTR